MTDEDRVASATKKWLISSKIVLLFMATLCADRQTVDAASPPVFAGEFSLDYIVSNHQFGFVQTGRWEVDHALQRERSDCYNETFQPRCVQLQASVHQSITSYRC